jgi:hypothetical protein
MGDLSSIPLGRIAAPEGVAIDGTGVTPSKDFSR